MEEKQDSLGRRWYVIHTYSGYENKVQANLERKVHSLGMEDKIFRIEIPMSTEVEVKENGEKHAVERKVFPGYVLIEMINDDTTWYAVRNTPGVTGFVGSGNKAIPLSEEEVRSIMGVPEEETSVYYDFQLQQVVRLKAGPFEDQIGRIAEINTERGKLKVLVEMFGRETPVEVDFKQVEEVE